MHTATLLSFQAELEKISSSVARNMMLAQAGIMGTAAAYGHQKGKDQAARGEEHSFGAPQVAGSLFLPGGMSYQVGRAIGHHRAGKAKIKPGKEKKSGLGAGALDVAGLGALAAPTIQHMRGKPMSDKAKNRTELLGLGTLGASVAAEHAGDVAKAGKAGLSKLRGLVSKMPKHAAPTMGAMMNMHRLADAAKAAKGVAKPLAQGAGKALTSPNNMGRATALAGHMAQGGHAWNPAAAAKRAISL